MQPHHWFLLGLFVLLVILKVVHRVGLRVQARAGEIYELIPIGEGEAISVREVMRQAKIGLWGAGTYTAWLERYGKEPHVRCIRARPRRRSEDRYYRPTVPSQSTDEEVAS